MISLTGLRAFVMVGKLGSVRKAAGAMNVDHASVSRQIRQLEDRLGVSLFNHEGRRLALTDVGSRYLRKLKPAFDLIEEATEDVSAGNRLQLELYMPPGFAHRVALPNLPSLQQMLPQWNVFLHTRELIPNQRSGSVEVEIFFSDRPSRGSEREHELLVQPRVFPVASPRLRPDWFSVTRVEDLCNFPLIAPDVDGLWGLWFRLAGVEPSSVLSGPNMPNTHIMMEAAALGQGVALVNETIARDAISNGEIAELLNTDVRLHCYFLAAPARKWNQVPVVNVRRWIQDLISPRGLSSLVESERLV